MNKYIVHVLEIHQTQIEVEAIDENNAIEKASNGDGLWVDNSTEFVESCDTDTWTVELIEEDDDATLTREGQIKKKMEQLKSMVEDPAIDSPLIFSALEDLEEELVTLNNDIWDSIHGDEDSGKEE